MHYCLEIIMPPTDDILKSVTEIMLPFMEDPGPEEEECVYVRYSFWDYWKIGGRYAGSKMQAQLDQVKLRAFNEELKKRNVTVAGLTVGKQSLDPSTQIPMVDAFWLEYFPESKSKHCPIFAHSNDKRAKISNFPDDVMKLSEAPLSMQPYKVIVAVPKWDDATRFEANFMVEKYCYNGVTSFPTSWDGTLGGALKMHTERVNASGREEYRQRCTPKDDWLVVTVDYHS